MSYPTPEEERESKLRGIHLLNGLLIDNKTAILPEQEFPEFLIETCKDAEKFYHLKYRALTRTERRFARGKRTKWRGKHAK